MRPVKPTITLSLVPLYALPYHVVEDELIVDPTVQVKVLLG